MQEEDAMAAEKKRKNFVTALSELFTSSAMNF